MLFNSLLTKIHFTIIYLKSTYVDYYTTKHSLSLCLFGAAIKKMIFTHSNFTFNPFLIKINSFKNQFVNAQLNMYLAKYS
jgi:hypothetical protein